jgi:hypothetical protein
VLLLAAELSRPAIACRLKLLDELDPVARAANEGARRRVLDLPRPNQPFEISLYLSCKCKHPTNKTLGRRIRGPAWFVLKMSACATGWERKS